MRLAKKIAILLLILIFSIISQDQLKAQESVLIYNYGPVTNLYYEWILELEGDLEDAKVSPDFIVIEDQAGESIPINYNISDSKVVVRPLVAYENNSTYRLVSSNEILSVNNSPAAYNYILEFNTLAINEEKYYTIHVEDMSEISPLNNDDYQGQALVTLSYDDGYSNWYYYALPLHSKYNIPATFNIIANKIYSGDELYMDSSEIWVASDLGIEIASHSLSHPFLIDLEEAEIRQEFEESKEILGGIVGEVSTLAVPYSFYSDEIREIAQDYFKGVRVYGNEMNSLTNYDSYWLKSYAVVNTMEFNTVQEWIDQAIKEKSWLIIMLHGITDDRVEEYETTPVILEEILLYISEQGKDAILPVSTKDGLQLTDLVGQER